MIFSYNWLKDYLKGKAPSAEKAAELLTFHSFEVENIEKKAGDWLFNIDVLPNRAYDCFAHLGVAREIAVLTGLKLKKPKVLDLPKNNFDGLKIEVRSAADCPRYSAVVIKGVKIGEAPQYIKERLKVCGLKSINNIVDIANYVMLETNQPLHAFDYDKIQGKTIIVRRAKRGEKIKALDDKTYKLNEDILVIAHSKKPIAIAGIKGGESTGIAQNTKNIIIEAANFEQGLVRDASKKLKLRTDASVRFENGLAPNLIDYAQKRAANLIRRYAAGSAAGRMIDFYPKKTRPKIIKLDLDYLNSLLGVEVSKQKAKNILTGLGFECSELGRWRGLAVKAPTRRLDAKGQEDLIEEVGRVYGFNKIKAVSPCVCLIPPKENKAFILENKVKDILTGLGFTETYNFSFMGQKQKRTVEIANPISSLNQYLRPDLKTHLLKAAQENLRFFDEARLFEIGTIFEERGAVAKEKKALGIILAKKPLQKAHFYQLKGAVEALFKKLGIKLEPKIEQTSSGFIFEMDFAFIVKQAEAVKQYQKIIKYPPVLRDLAVLAPRGTACGKIAQIIKRTGGGLLESLKLFEVYGGRAVPKGKENFAFHLTYQSKQKTLSAKDVEELHQKIIKALEKNSGWLVRK